MKEYLIVSVFLISAMIVSGCTSPSIQQCINEYATQNLTAGQDFVAGEILVGFKENVTEDEAISIINSYGLEFGHDSPNTMIEVWGMVIVPEDSEFEWICTLQENPNIEYAEPNYLYYAG